MAFNHWVPMGTLGMLRWLTGEVVGTGLEWVTTTSLCWGQWGHFNPWHSAPARPQQIPPSANPHKGPQQRQSWGSPTSPGHCPQSHGRDKAGGWTALGPPGRSADAGSHRIAELSPLQT